MASSLRPVKWRSPPDAGTLVGGGEDELELDELVELELAVAGGVESGLVVSGERDAELDRGEVAEASSVDRLVRMAEVLTGPGAVGRERDVIAVIDRVGKVEDLLVVRSSMMEGNVSRLSTVLAATAEKRISAGHLTRAMIL